MRIIMHGATNRGSSNFGDFIYGEVFYRFIKNIDNRIECTFYQPSEYFIKYVEGYVQKKICIRKSDLILYLPGGYFGEPHKTSLKGSIIHFLRFMPLGLFGTVLNKKIAIIGVGAGPINSMIFKLPISIIGKHSETISVRDKESYEALKTLKIKNITLAFDPILGVDIKALGKNTSQIEKIKSKVGNKKILFVHYNHSRNALSQFATAVNLFVDKNPQYIVVVGSDCIMNIENELFNEFRKKIKCDCIHYKYDSPHEFISFLDICDMVLTCKLHAGVVAGQLGKSVICIADHPEKTSRYYEHIGEKERCISLYESNSDQIYNLLEKYKDKDIIISDEIIQESCQNFEMLKELVGKDNE